MLNTQVPTDMVENKTENEILMVENEYWKSLYESLERLKNGNPQPDDFKKVILDGYFKDRAVNGVSLLAMDRIKQMGARPDIMESLVSISALQDYFITIENMGSMPIEDDDEE
ncbi:MAG: hypothetical protein PVF17_00350 [Ignavibacteria bacterium]|jgi:hypothetical protein